MLSSFVSMRPLAMHSAQCFYEASKQALSSCVSEASRQTLSSFVSMRPLAMHSAQCFYSDAGRDWGQEEKGMTEDEMAGFRAEQGTSLETPSRARASFCQEVGTTWFFSSCGGILELRRGITGFLLCLPWVAQSSILVVPGCL